MKRLLNFCALMFTALFSYAHAAEITRGDIAALGSSSTVMTINQSGIYPLTSNYTGQILISANNVTLDMQGFVITGGTYGVRITGNNCTVQNGTITGAQVGVRIESNNNDIINLDLVANGTGMQIVSGNNNVVDNCQALQNTSAGFSLTGAQNNMFVDCAAIGNGSNAYAYGFITQDGNGNTFENCIAENTATTGSSPFYAAGFVLTGTEQKSNVINSIALNASGVSNYGMLISGTVAQYNVLKDNQISGNVIGARDDYAFTSSASTNLWMGNLGNNNTTNFNIGSQYPTSAASGTGVGVTENIDAASTAGGPAEKIMATIVDQVSTASTRIGQLLPYNPTFVTGVTTLGSDNTYYLVTQRVNGQITLNGRTNVILDLNGFAVGNILADNCNNLTIINGFVRPTDYPTGTSTTPSTECIALGQTTICNNVTMRNVMATGGSNAFRVYNNGKRMTMISCIANSNSNSGLVPFNGLDGLCELCQANKNASAGINITALVGRYRMAHCQANRNGAADIVVDFTEIRSCSAVGTGATSGIVAAGAVANNILINNFSANHATNYTASSQWGNAVASNVTPQDYSMNITT